MSADGVRATQATAVCTQPSRGPSPLHAVVMGHHTARTKWSPSRRRCLQCDTQQLRKPSRSSGDISTPVIDPRYMTRSRSRDSAGPASASRQGLTSSTLSDRSSGGMDRTESRACRRRPYTTSCGTSKPRTRLRRVTARRRRMRARSASGERCQDESAGRHDNCPDEKHGHQPGVGASMRISACRWPMTQATAVRIRSWEPMLPCTHHLPYMLISTSILAQHPYTTKRGGDKSPVKSKSVALMGCWPIFRRTSRRRCGQRQALRGHDSRPGPDPW